MTSAYTKMDTAAGFKSGRAHAHGYNGSASLWCSCEEIDNLGWPYDANPSVNSFGPHET